MLTLNLNEKKNEKQNIFKISIEMGSQSYHVLR